MRRSSVSLDKKKKNTKSTTIPLGGEKYTCIEGLIHRFLSLKQLNDRIILGIQKFKG